MTDGLCVIMDGIYDCVGIETSDRVDVASSCLVR